MDSKGRFHIDGPNLEGAITGDLAGSQISVVFKDTNDVALDQAPLESPAARRLAGLDMICTDLKLSLRGFQRYLEIVGVDDEPTLPADSVVIEALWTSSIVTYCKPFVSAEGRTVVLKFNQVFKGDLLGKLEEHNKLMKLRNEHMAHCGAVGLQQHLVFLLKRPDQDQAGATIQTWGINARLPHPRWVKSSLELVTGVLDRVQAMRKDAENGLRKELNLGAQADLGKLIIEVNVNKP